MARGKRPTRVYFITNRDVSGSPLLAASYGSGVISPTLRTGIAEVVGGDPATLADGTVAPAIREAQVDVFSDEALAELAKEKNIMFFIHGFANSFADAISRAAFVRDWFAASGAKDADCAVVAFTWPSPGISVSLENVIRGVFGLSLSLVLLPFLGKLVSPAADEYFADQARATASGNGLLSALDRLVPLLESARRRKGKTFLMAHSMGHQLLASALVRPQAPGSLMFDEAFLTAADCKAAATGEVPAWFKTLQAIAGRVHIYASQQDDILKVSHGVNGVARLGESGAIGLAASDAGRLRIVDCTATKPMDVTSDGNTGHYYYRRVPSVRADITSGMGGGGKAGATSLSG